MGRTAAKMGMVLIKRFPVPLHKTYLGIDAVSYETKERHRIDFIGKCEHGFDRFDFRFESLPHRLGDDRSISVLTWTRSGLSMRNL